MPVVRQLNIIVMQEFSQKCFV